MTSSVAGRDYYENRWHGTPLGPDDVVRVPTAMALFPNELAPEGEPPSSLVPAALRDPALDRYPRGGHFAAADSKKLLANDIAEFFTSLL